MAIAFTTICAMLEGLFGEGGERESVLSGRGSSV